MNPLDDDLAAWLAADPDPASRDELSALDRPALTERFAGTLRFGTAGLRGPVRAGPNGMNVAVVTRATAGVAAWLNAHGYGGGTVVVGRDARHGSEDFAATTAEVMAAAGFDVVALPEPLPTPIVAFSCRDLAAVAGIQVTASHNPPADNGYKVYLAGGGQLVPPSDSEIESLIDGIGPANLVARQTVSIDERGRAATGRYLDRLTARFGPPEVSARPIRVALTPMHGVGGRLTVEALHRAGFDDVHVVDEQFAPDPDFPTVAFPNPEEPGASDLLLNLAERINADVAIALDPDADRCAVGARIDGQWRMLTGDETGGLLGNFVLANRHTGGERPNVQPGAGSEASGPNKQPVVASTIVSGSLLRAVANRFGARHVSTLTGFKWLVRAGEPLAYVYEEAIGHCVDPDAVRDKDGISAAVALALITRRQVMAGSDLGAALTDLFSTYGLHVTAQRAIRVEDLADIAALMTRLRTDPPTSIDAIEVTASDYAARTDSLRTDAVEFRGTADDGVTLRVMARPSGTEPKLKYYIEMISPPTSAVMDHAGLAERVGKVAAMLPDRA